MTTGSPNFCTFHRSVLSLLCTYAFYCGEALLKSCEQRSYITLSCGRMQELSCECINFDIEIKSQTRKKKKSRISVWKTWAAGIGSCCNRISENPFVLATANHGFSEAQSTRWNTYFSHLSWVAMNVIKRARGVRHFRLNVKEDLDSSPWKSMQFFS